jgi:hypothetical protein
MSGRGGDGGGAVNDNLPCNQYYVNGELRTCPEFEEYNKSRRACEMINDVGCTAKREPFVPSQEEFLCPPGRSWGRDHRFPCNKIVTPCGGRGGIYSPQGMCWKLEGNEFVQVHCTTLPGCRARGVTVVHNTFDISEIECTSENVGQTWRSRRNPCFTYYECRAGGNLVTITCDGCSTGSSCGSCYTLCGRYNELTPMEIYSINTFKPTNGNILDTVVEVVEPSSGLYTTLR